MGERESQVREEVMKRQAEQNRPEEAAGETSAEQDFFDQGSPDTPDSNKELAEA